MRLHALTFSIGALIVGIILGWFVFRASDQPASPQMAQVRVNLSEYQFINPLLFSDNPRSVSSHAEKLRRVLDRTISTNLGSSSVQSISVYYRDLNSGEWTGVNENIAYKPSSMLKVIAMMAALKVAEGDPTILTTNVHFKKSLSGGLYYEGNKTMQEGDYPLEELINVMIKDSDNDAFRALVSDKRIDTEFVKTYKVFRLPPEGLKATSKGFMSPASYAVVFRILYNSTFFSWSVSEQALDLLTQTTFDRGLVAGVPSGIKVAHKFGEHLDELHDCGIIYHPSRPYLLCVMTKGSDLPALENVIATLSRVVYDSVDRAP